MADSGDYAGCIDVALKIHINYSDLASGNDRKLATFNQVIKLDPTLVSTVSKKKSTRGTPNMAAMIAEAQSAGYIGTTKDWAIIANPIEYEEEEEAAYTISPNSTLCYGEDSGMVFIQLGGYLDSADLAYENTEGTSADMTLVHLYLKPQDGKDLTDAPSGILLATDDEATAASMPACMAPTFVSSFSTDPASPNSSDTEFSPEFYPTSTWTITFTGIKNADGSAADNVVLTVNDGEAVEAPTLVNYNDGDFDYTATGWDKEVVTPAAADATYTAQYAKKNNDATALQTEVTADEALKEDDYKSGWDNFATKLAAAQTVLENNASDNPDNWPTATEIATALSELQTAKSQLVPKDVFFDITFVWTTENGDQRQAVPTQKDTVPTPPQGSTDGYETATTTYTFAGWLDENKEPVDALAPATEATTYTAYYTDAPKTATISFVYRVADGESAYREVTTDGTVVNIGSAAADCVPADAVTFYTNDGLKEYQLTGWSPELGEVSGDTQYVAQYTMVEHPADYTAVDTAIAAYNEMKQADPNFNERYTKDSRDAVDKAINDVVRGLPDRDQELVNQMAAAIQDAMEALETSEVTVTYNVRGTETTEKFAYGTAAADVAAKAPTVPQTIEDGDYDYTFTTWSPDFTDVVADGCTYYHAQFDETFVPISTEALERAIAQKIAERDNGTEWTEESVAGLNELIQDAQKYLQDPQVYGRSTQPQVTADTNTILNYELIEKQAPVTQYTIIFQDWDATEISKQVVNAGDSITVPENPTRPDSADGNFSYTFIGWGEDVVNPPTESKTYTAQYETVTHFADLAALNTAIGNANNKVAAEQDIFDEKYANADAYRAAIQGAQDLADSNPLLSQQGTVDQTAQALENFELVPNQFTITFKQTKAGDTERILDYGATPQEPAFENFEDGDDDVAQTGWDATIVPATSNATYNATYSRTFVKANYGANDTAVAAANQILGTENADKIYTSDSLSALQTAVDNNVEQGLGRTHQGEVNTATDNINNAIDDMQYQIYTVKFYVDGSEYASNDYHYNDDLQVPASPTKAPDNTYTYSFSGWTPAPAEKVTATTTYNGSFEPTYIEYTVKFVVDGQDYDVQTLHFGDTVVAPTDPTKAPSVSTVYSFTGWTPEIVPVAGDATYTAQFDESARKYTIKFVVDDTEVKSDEVAYGETPVAPADPTKDPTATTVYTFAGWDPAVEPVACDQTYTAQFDESARKYTIKFVVDGTEVKSDEVAYGETPVAPADPTKDPSVSTVYTFAGWDPAIAPVAGDQTYTAQFDESPRMYTVTIITKSTTDASDVTATQDVAFGDTPAMPTPATGFVVGSTQYDFTGWNPEVAPVDGDVTYTAQYTETPVQGDTYTINFKYADTAEQAVAGEAEYADHTAVYAKDATVSVPTPEDFTTASASYKFTGWDKEVGPAEADVTYVAQYDVTPLTETFEINFRYAATAAEVDDGHLEDHFQTVAEGEKPEVPTPADFTDGNTTYTFVGWDKEVVAATEDTVYTAIYKVETVFVPDMTEIEALVERYNDMVQSGEYVQEDLDAVKAYIDDIYDKYDNNEFANQEEVDEMAVYLKYLEDNCRKIETPDDDKKDDDNKDTDNTDKKEADKKSSSYKKYSSSSPSTGDNATLVVMSVILVASIGLAVVTLNKRRKEDF